MYYRPVIQGYFKLTNHVKQGILGWVKLEISEALGSSVLPREQKQYQFDTNRRNLELSPIGCFHNIQDSRRILSSPKLQIPGVLGSSVLPWMVWLGSQTRSPRLSDALTTSKIAKGFFSHRSYKSPRPLGVQCSPG